MNSYKLFTSAALVASLVLGNLAVAQEQQPLPQTEETPKVFVTVPSPDQEQAIDKVIQAQKEMTAKDADTQAKLDRANKITEVVTEILRTQAEVDNTQKALEVAKNDRANGFYLVASNGAWTASLAAAFVASGASLVNKQSNKFMRIIGFAGGVGTLVKGFEQGYITAAHVDAYKMAPDKISGLNEALAKQKAKLKSALRGLWTANGFSDAQQEALMKTLKMETTEQF